MLYNEKKNQSPLGIGSITLGLRDKTTHNSVEKCLVIEVTCMNVQKPSLPDLGDYCGDSGIRNRPTSIRRPHYVFYQN